MCQLQITAVCTTIDPPLPFSEHQRVPAALDIAQQAQRAALPLRAASRNSNTVDCQAQARPRLLLLLLLLLLRPRGKR